MKKVLTLVFIASIVIAMAFEFSTSETVYAAGVFADKEAVVVWIGDHPSQMADLLENNLSQAQITQFEALTVTVATDDQELNLLQRALEKFKREGVTTASIIDPIVARIAVLESP